MFETFNSDVFIAKEGVFTGLLRHLSRLSVRQLPAVSVMTPKHPGMTLQKSDLGQVPAIGALAGPTILNQGR